MSSIISDYIMKKYFSPFRADEADMQRVFGSGMLEVQRELRSEDFAFHYFLRKPALTAARKMYPERCINVSDSSGSTSIDAMHG